METQHAADPDLDDDINRLRVTATPAQPVAGAETALRVRITCSPLRDLTGESVEIHDADGNLVASALFTGFDGDTNETDDILVRAPATAGEHIWVAVLRLQDDEDLPEEETSAQFTLDVKAHKPAVLVWGLPSAIAAGEAFTAQVGLKCLSGCDMAGRLVEVTDQAGTSLARAIMGSEIRPGTQALHFIPVNLQAPAEEGLHQWRASVSSEGMELTHEDCTTSFSLRVVRAPDFAVKVRVIDADSQQPIANANVVMHPFRGSTDAGGEAVLRVHRGSYRMLVSAKKYDPVVKELDIDGDMETLAAMSVEPPDDPDAMYY